jgi:hypothetical protein
MVFIETPIFTKIIGSLLDDAEYRAMQEALVIHPHKGAIIKHSGGLRKLRWGLDQRGKSGGIRIIYYWLAADDQIYMLYAFAKNSQENLTTKELDILRSLVEGWSR